MLTSDKRVETSRPHNFTAFFSRFHLNYFKLQILLALILQTKRPDRFWGQSVRLALSTELKQLELKADRSPPSSAEVKNDWSYTSSHPIRHHSVKRYFGLNRTVGGHVVDMELIMKTHSK